MDAPPRRLFLRRLVSSADRWLLPGVVFVLLYVASFFLLRLSDFPWNQWAGLLSGISATAGSILFVDRGRFGIGLTGGPLVASRDTLLGLAIGAAIIGAADLSLGVAGVLRRSEGSGLPWAELLIVFLPAAVHEELLFRGYVYQKLRLLSRVGAMLATSVLFAALHAGNRGIGWLAFVNLFLGGLLLAEAFELKQRLWLPIALHFAWNITSGPLLGYAVSGYIAERSMWRTVIVAALPVSGGEFGLEGSVVITAVELLAIALLEGLNRRKS
jgi:uncharacterized protein